MPKDKDSYWFKHDSNSGRGLRLKKLQAKYNHWGKGVYWDVIEVLREQSGYKYENSPEAISLLGQMIGLKSDEDFKDFFAFCMQISLFKTKGQFFYSEVLLKNMKNWETKKTNGSKGGRPKTGNKKNRNESESKANRKRTVTIREEKRREDNSYLANGNFLRVGTETIQMTPSEYFQKSNSITFDTWKTQNPVDASLSEKVFKIMDSEYIGYDFKDDNHVKRTFFSILRTVKSTPVNNSQTSKAISSLIPK